VKKAFQDMRYPVIQGVECRVLPYTLKYAKVQSKSGDAASDERSTYVFVKGFSKARWNHSDLYRAFESHGLILSAKVSIDRYH
jgi:hypothetical protein